MFCHMESCDPFIQQIFIESQRVAGTVLGIGYIPGNKVEEDLSSHEATMIVTLKAKQSNGGWKWRGGRRSIIEKVRPEQR